MRRELANLIEVQQGSNWEFDITVYDDDVYKTKLLDFLEVNKETIGGANYSAISLLVSTDIDQGTFKVVIENMLIETITSDMQISINDIFEEVQSVDLTGKQVKIYFQIFKSTASNRTMSFNYLGVLGDSGKVSFNIPAEETQQMVYKSNREYDERLLGFYTIELQEESTKKVVRLLEGDLEVIRGAKIESEFQTTE